MIDARAGSCSIPEFPSLEKQRLAMALRAFTALAQGRLNDAERCLDALAIIAPPGKASAPELAAAA